MEANEDKKKINDDMVVFMRKRSETDADHYKTHLRNVVDIQNKRLRAAAAREHHKDGKISSGPGKKDTEQRDKSENGAKTRPEATMRRSNCGLSGEHGSEDGRLSRRRGGDEKGIRGRSFSRSRSGEPSDRCGRRRRRRRRCGRRRRRRSCRRRRRRRRSGRRRRRRRSCRRRRRRRRSCSRRRRRRSCRRRRRGCRRRRRRRC